MVMSFLIDDFFLLILHLHQNHNQVFDRYEYDDVEFVRESKNESFSIIFPTIFDLQFVSFD